GGRLTVDACGVGYLAVLHRNIEVEPHQNALGGNLNIIERNKGGHAKIQMSLAIATAVSAMRFENPHSLSYHDITRTKLPLITLVWSSAKEDDAGLWLKSAETSGASTMSRMPFSSWLAARFIASLISFGVVFLLATI